MNLLVSNSDTATQNFTGILLTGKQTNEAYYCKADNDAESNHDNGI